MRKLKEPCRSCGKPLDPRWRVCPYCEAEVAGFRDGLTERPRRSRREQERAERRTERTTAAERERRDPRRGREPAQQDLVRDTTESRGGDRPEREREREADVTTRRPASQPPPR